jgi:hypothetical protein
MAPMTRAKSAARPTLEALDDGLLLRIADVMISDDSARRGMPPHDAQRPEAAWHPAHLARLACVSRCVRRGVARAAERSAACGVVSCVVALDLGR